MHGLTAQPCVVGRNENEGGEEIDDQVFFKIYRNTTFVKHLGNLLGSIRMFNHHLIETKRPRTPLKLPHLRYRIRDLRELNTIQSY